MYAYVGNDPANWSDPSGMCPVCVGGAVGAGAGFLIELVAQTYDVVANDGSYDGKALTRSTIVGGMIGLTGGMGGAAASAAGAGRAGTALMTGVGAVPGAATGATVDLILDGEMNPDGYGGEIVGAAAGSMVGGYVDDVAAGLLGGSAGSRTATTVISNAVDAMTATETADVVEGIENPGSNLAEPPQPPPSSCVGDDFVGPCR